MSRSIWQNYGQVVASKYRRGIVLVLHNRPMTPTEISKEMGVNIAHISRSLRELVEKQVVICLTPNRKKGRVYSLTEKGIEIAKILGAKITIEK
jgi:predicted transcriptional regulator